MQVCVFQQQCVIKGNNAIHLFIKKLDLFEEKQIIT